MSIENSIAPTDLRNYAKSHGWVLVKEAAGNRLYVLNHPGFDRRQLVFPMDTTAPDYAEAAMLVIEKLAMFEERPVEAVLESLREATDDTFAFRVDSPHSEDQSLPLSFVRSMIEGAQQLLLASVGTVLKPQVHHPQLSRAEGQEILDTARFRHTRPGSFILNVSCPIQATGMSGQPQIIETEVPLVRLATLALHTSLSSLVSSIETDSLVELVQSQKQSPSPIISSNFCEALTRFEEKTLKNSLEVAITWASSFPLPFNTQAISRVRVQHDYFARIEEVRRELRSPEEELNDTFIGTVETLEGEMRADGRRAGDVILSLLLVEGGPVRVRAHLNAEEYEKAGEVHMQAGTYIKVTGVLHPGRQPRRLSDLRSFDVIRG